MGAKSKIDQYIIDRVRERRKEFGIDQVELSIRLGLAEGFVSQVESSKRREKYNLKHINKLANILKCSPRDFLPESPFPEEDEL